MRRRAKAIDSEAFRWVVLQERGLSASEQRRLDAWLAKSPRHRGALIRAQALTAYYQRVGALARGRYVIKRLPFWHRRQMLTGALSAVALAAIGAIVRKEWLEASLSGERHETRVGQVQRLALQDGSEVLLNTATEVAVNYGGNHREVRLGRGEAIFSVLPELRPFIVHVGRWILRSARGSFAVRQNAPSIIVAVEEGSLEVLRATASRTQELRQLLASQEITLGDVSVRVRQLSRAEIVRRLAWREGRVLFDGESIREAVGEMNRYSTRKIVAPDLSLFRQPISGGFRISDVDTFLLALQEGWGVHAEVTGNEILLKPPYPVSQ
jgi:transmembrane sensor